MCTSVQQCVQDSPCLQYQIIFHTAHVQSFTKSLSVPGPFRRRSRGTDNAHNRSGSRVLGREGKRLTIY